MIGCVIFDFDGTLVNSNAIKNEAFYTVAAKLSQERLALERILSLSDIGDRHNVFERFSTAIGVGSDEENLALARELSNAYTELCYSQISTAPEIKGATDTLKQLATMNIRRFISSATPYSALTKLVASRVLPCKIHDIYGAPMTKVEHILHISSSTKLKPEEIIYVGDSEGDLSAATKTGCNFVAVRVGGENRFTTEPDFVVDNLLEILPIIDMLSADRRAGVTL